MDSVTVPVPDEPRPAAPIGKPLDRRKGWWTKIFEDAVGIPDDARVGAFLLVLTFIGATAWSVYTTGHFDPQTWGIGCGAMCVGVGAWFGIRRDQ